MANTSNYTHLDISRYLDKKMTKQEMHDFEKAMLEDPFLADAYEGFAKTNVEVARSHIADIERKLLHREEQAKVVEMTPSGLNWWKIAVMFIIIIGIGFTGYLLINNSTQPTEMAVNKTMSPPVLQDSISPGQKPLVVPEILPSQKQDVAVNEKGTSPIISDKVDNSLATLSSSPKQEESSAEALESRADVATANEPTSQTQQAAPSAKSMALDGRSASSVDRLTVTREFKGKVLDPAGEPLPFATLHGSRNVGTVADANGNFSLRAPDSVLDVSVVALGYATTRARIKSNVAANEISLNEKEESDLAEVVVTGMVKRKNVSREQEKVIINKGSGVEPEQGWKRLEEYFKQSLQQVRDTSNVYINGFVELEFTIDNKGIPVDIKVIKATKDVLATKAIALLKNGPKWKRKKINNKGNIRISF